MIPWIADNEKFALIGLQVDTDSSVVDGQVIDGFEAYTSLKLDMPGHWREWLGTTSVEGIEQCSLFLVGRSKSLRPNVLDGENLLLTERVGRWNTGLMLVCPYEAAQDPFTASGTMTNGELDFRQCGTLHEPHDSLIPLGGKVTAQQLMDAANIAIVIKDLMQTPGTHLWRLFRCLFIYQQARTLPDIMDRIHQFARCIEGLLATGPGTSKARFKSRTELFIGPSHHETMGTIYDIRSEVEHLHEDLRLTPFDRAKRLEMAKMEAIVSELARKVLGRILGEPNLAIRLGSRDSLEKFWQLEREKQRDVWGPVHDLMAPLEGVADKHISDRDLGAE